MKASIPPDLPTCASWQVSTTFGLVLLLAGCATEPQRVTTFVPVPVECRVAEPARPAMPLDALPDAAKLDAFVQAATAEREVREGYEGELLAALRICTASLAIKP